MTEPNTPDELVARFDAAAAAAMAIDESERQRLNTLLQSIRFGFKLGRHSDVPWEQIEAEFQGVRAEHRRSWMSAVFDRDSDDGDDGESGEQGD